MKLYLSSYFFGNNPRSLSELVGTNKKAAVIVNAIDFLTDAERDERLQAESNSLSDLGLQPEELDLRDYFGNPTDLKRKLSEYGLLWLRGGNVFVLRRAMAQSGFDQVIHAVLQGNGVVYGGYSAGACVASPSLHGLELADDPHIVPSGYKSEIVWAGLDLIDFAIAPRYHADHPEAAAVEQIALYFTGHSIPYKTLPAGEVIVIDGDSENMVS